MKQKETDSPYPFKIELDDRIDFSSTTFRIYFKKFPDKEEFRQAIVNWAEKGIEEGYGEQKMHYIEDEPDEFGEGGFEWNEEENWVEFYADLGTDLPEESKNRNLDAFYQALLNFREVEKVKIGSGYGDWRFF